MGSAEDWKEIERLFSTAVDLPASEQARFLDGSCGDRPRLREKVERLLAASRTEEDVIEAAIGRAASEVAESQQLSTEGAGRIGPYRIIRRIGEGGMGEVYLGERDDGTYHQRVAIKVVKKGLRGQALNERFRQERQILAQLAHPAIARLLDGGTTPDGRHYLVMEYVEGEAIDGFCDRRNLSVRGRLQLFRELCAAVSNAHAQLVVHRDIKPANVLITPDGQPKLLDFGISKLLDGSSGDPALTTVSHRVLTPAYASPEQLRDEPITTAVDIYSLGVLLHQLLVGRLPYPIADAQGEALRRAICEAEVERPSKAAVGGGDEEAVRRVALSRDTTPERLGKQLRGDLDQIVGKALRKQPRDRYASVEQLSADLGRHLDGLPIEAHRGGWRYRASRFVARHRTAVFAIVAAVGAAILALSIGLVGQMREADRADREAAASARVVEFLIELFSAADPYQTRQEVSAREILDLGVARIERELTGRPLVQARLMATMGRVYHNRGLFAEAASLQRGALERWREGLAPDHPTIASAHLDLADNLRVLGKTQEALPHYDRALRLRLAHFGAESAEVAEVRNNTALSLIRLADYSAAETHLQAALDSRRRLPDMDYPVAQSLHNLTLIALRKGDYRTAVDRGRETLEIKARILAADHPSTGRTLLVLARAHWQLGQLAEAERLIVASLDILRATFGDRHVDVLNAESDWAHIRHLRGSCHLQGSCDGRDHDDAESRLRAILERKRQHLSDPSSSTVTSLIALATVLRDRGDLAAAEPLLREALATGSTIHGDAHPRVATAQAALGELLLVGNRLDEAEPLLRRAHDTRRQSLPAGHPDISHSSVGLAELAVARGDCEPASQLAARGLEVLRAALPPDHRSIARAEELLAACR
ncbi:MAG: serine/threonine-protein kinase [Acidobacteriota bacterium]